MQKSKKKKKHRVNMQSVDNFNYLS